MLNTKLPRFVRIFIDYLRVFAMLIASILFTKSLIYAGLIATSEGAVIVVLLEVYLLIAFMLVLTKSFDMTEALETQTEERKRQVEVREHQVEVREHQVEVRERQVEAQANSVQQNAADINSNQQDTRYTDLDKLPVKEDSSNSNQKKEKLEEANICKQNNDLLEKTTEPKEQLLCVQADLKNKRKHNNPKTEPW